ncbi:MAG: FumA C-terminus/TtdB family hydratase beta subunit [Candidatus Gastranaerophilales bacterium]|nr:FumA C-terminus/TtdB family hydratase beta subunit [Candidatus Gastranaerophilales bacterium]
MVEISTNLIKNAVYKLCFDANTTLDNKVYSKILSAYQTAKSHKMKYIFASILENAKIAFENKRPLCQDTGQVIIFLEIGQDVHISGEPLKTAINQAVQNCYCENFFRKSIVKNAIFERLNTNTNTPCIIHSEIVEGNKIKISVLIKGAGSENKSLAKMLLPTSTKEDVKNFIVKSILDAGINSCPPIFAGVGIGGTLEDAAILSKKALLINTPDPKSKNFEKEIIKTINQNAPEDFDENLILGLNILTEHTHIACLPVSVTINCHSSREASAEISSKGTKYFIETPDFADISADNQNTKIVNLQNTNEMRSLKKGDSVLLSGTLYVARDAAHQRLAELIKQNKNLPFEIKNATIFYAGPCPANESEIIGPIGPTTSSRMDKFAPDLYDLGLLATIGKGQRSGEVTDSIKKNNGLYLTVTGGVASLLKSKISSSYIVAYEDLGAEAIYKLEVENLPAIVQIAK